MKITTSLVTACNCPQKHPDHACLRAKSSGQSGQQRQMPDDANAILLPPEPSYSEMNSDSSAASAPVLIVINHCISYNQVNGVVWGEQRVRGIPSPGKCQCQCQSGTFSVARRRRRRFRIDRGGPLHGSSSPLWHFEPVRVKPN